MIPEFARSMQDIVRHVQVFVFDYAGETELAFLHKSGQKYQVITSEAQDSIYAIINSQDTTVNTEAQLSKLISMVLEESLGVETM